MRRYVVLLILLVVAGVLRAQFDPQIGQYMYLPTSYNPAAAGEDDLMKVAGLHRMQYVDITNAPMTTYFSFSSPFVIGKTKHGAGVRFMNDRFGLWTNQALHLQYCYRQKLGKGYLSAGVDLGFLNVGFKGDSVNLRELSSALPDQYQEADDLIPSGSVSGMGFDMGLGLYYKTSKWWVGASYSHLTQPKVSWLSGTKEIEVRPRGTMYVGGGYDFRLRRHRDWKLSPSALLMTDFTSWDINTTLMCEYKDKYRWGLGYRIGASVNILLGIDIISGLQLGYTVEIPTNMLITESYGSHEIYLSYGFDILKPKLTNRYKSVRYL